MDSFFWRSFCLAVLSLVVFSRVLPMIRCGWDPGMASPMLLGEPYLAALRLWLRVRRGALVWCRPERVCVLLVV